jgi:DNA-binding MarR family transcriptional regulator/GNAT superfamily N-acetyltransferase
MPVTTTVPATRVQAVRRFNRFYTRQIGLLEEGLLASPFSLTEVRVLYELAHRDSVTASELTRELGLDPGYLSRMLAAFARQGLLSKAPSKADGRQTLLKLTAKGRKTFTPLDRRSSEQVARILGRLPAAGQKRLVETMGVVEELLEPTRDRKALVRLRAPRPGDLGWVVHRHGVLYAQEYGWDERFEALVAGIVAHFVQDFDPERERCWIAEREGAIVGSVFLVRQSETVARLRMLLVEPSARGLGIGARLVEECLSFARSAGYRTMTLWTSSVLLEARHIYEKAGFRTVKAEPDASFGPTLIAETWERAL